MNRFSFEGTGTVWSIDIYDFIDPQKLAEIQGKIIAIVREFERLYSRFDPNSMVRSLYNKVGVFEVNAEFIQILDIYFTFNKITNGLFTPLVGQLLNDLGYDENYSFQKKEVREVPRLEASIKVLSQNKVQILEPVEIDFGGVGKGFLVDKISGYLREQEILKFCVDGGGDLYFGIQNSKLEIKNFKIRVGLEDPLDSERVIGVCNLKGGQSICSSANNRRKWEVYSHIMQPVQKSSSEKILASWVVTSCASLADTIATCLFLAEPDVLLKYYNFEYLILNNDFSVTKSKGFDAEIFI